MVGLAATLNPMRSTSAGAAAGRDRSPLVGGNRTLRTLREGKIASSCIVNIARTARLEADSIMVSGKLELLGNGGPIWGGGGGPAQKNCPRNFFRNHRFAFVDSV